MRKNSILGGLIILGALLASCQKTQLTYTSEDVCVHIKEGKNWLHNYPLLLGINKKNPPQIALWIEDEQGRYITTLYASQKIANASWQNASGNTREEALPHWSHRRGQKRQDGGYNPTKKNPLTDGLSGATPRGSFQMRYHEKTSLTRYRVKVEVNHSTDFNESYPKNAPKGSSGYSGGPEGSGQPALVYEARIDTSLGTSSFKAQLIGHSSPDGSSGEVFPDMEGLTSALNIIESIDIILK